MPLPNAIVQARCDVVLADVAAQLAALQAEYARRHGGRYWQGLPTHAIPPADGADEAPSRRSARPTDQAETWNAGADWAGVSLPATMPLAVRVDVYDGPNGRGYTISGEVRIGATAYMRRVNVGPETWRERDWASTWHA